MFAALATAGCLAQAPRPVRVRLETSQGPIVLQIHPDWAPRGAARFLALVRAHYYDGARFFRVIAGRWAQFGIAGDPAVAAAWRTRTIPDDPPRHPNLRGTVAFAFAVRDGRITQVFINLRDNSATLDRQGFAPFAEVIQGMTAVDRLFPGYGEHAGGGIRAGHQQALFAGGNAWLALHFPKLDFIRTAHIYGSMGQ
ncbi:MAG: peptidylprolyl isomerase [Terriglobales bacterium]